MSKRLALLLVLVLVLAAACGGGGDNDEDSASAEPATETATTDDTGDTVEAEATRDESDIATLPELTESVTSQNGITINYPAGWSDPIATIGVFIFSTDSASSAPTLGRLSAGELYFQVNVQPATSGRSLSEELDFFFSNFAEALNVTLSEPQAIQVGEMEAVAASGKNDSLGLTVAVLPVTEQDYVTFAAYTNGAELEQQEPLITAILESIQYDTADG